MFHNFKDCIIYSVYIKFSYRKIKVETLQIKVQHNWPLSLLRLVCVYIYIGPIGFDYERSLEGQTPVLVLSDNSWTKVLDY